MSCVARRSAAGWASRLFGLLDSRVPERKGIMRSLGEFVGHIVRATKADPNKHVVSRTTEERTEQTEDGKVVLRRTTIEEVEYENRR